MRFYEKKQSQQSSLLLVIKLHIEFCSNDEIHVWNRNFSKNYRNWCLIAVWYQWLGRNHPPCEKRVIKLTFWFVRNSRRSWQWWQPNSKLLGTSLLTFFTNNSKIHRKMYQSYTGVLYYLITTCDRVLRNNGISTKSLDQHDHSCHDSNNSQSVNPNTHLSHTMCWDHLCALVKFQRMKWR